MGAQLCQALQAELGKPHGEAADVPVEPTGVARLKELIKQYAPRDVYNADEFALY